jgi:hypothetical protein
VLVLTPQQKQKGAGTDSLQASKIENATWLHIKNFKNQYYFIL